ncbi:MAG TPA: OsmC family protein [Gammaproteobacteria bacterium]|nr:OsmC family protein [Gammaproteobacteria bacterium]
MKKNRIEIENAAGEPPETPPVLVDGEVLVTELDRRFLRGMYGHSHFLRADEPSGYGGSDLGPTPYDLLLMSLGACTSMTLRMYANRRHMPLEDLQVRLRHERVHAEDCVDCEEGIERITRRITLIGDLSTEEREKLLDIADRCPVHRTLQADLRIETELAD